MNSLAVEQFCAEKNGTKIYLIPLDTEFYGEQPIQNLLKSSLGKFSTVV